MAKYGKAEGHHCWWLTIDGKSVANFDDEKEVDSLIKLEAENADLEKWVNNALEALEAVKASGAIHAEDVLGMIELGLSGKPQHPNTRLG